MGTNQAWICTVCGYVHQGPVAPDVCPVCGATADLFEPYQEPAPVVESAQAWICTVCGYVHEGSGPPNVCPVCAAGADMFEPYQGEVQAPAASDATAQHVVIAGAGIAGVSAADAVHKAAPEAKITLLSKESDLPYYRLNLTRYLAGEVDAASLALHPADWYRGRNIDLQREAELCRIHPESKQVNLRQGDDLSYDQLILAVGSHPFVPPIPGVQRDNVTTLRTRAQADFILEQGHVDRPCVVIGGGILGLEAAGALAQRGLKVSLLEGFGWLLPRQLNERAGALLAEKARAKGIDILHQAQTKELVGDQRVREVQLANGTTLPAELVIITTGVRANSYTARLAGLDVHNGIVVDNHLQSSVPGILAAGDVAEHHGICYGIWGPAQFQGAIAGMNAVGERSEFGGLPRTNMLKVLGYDMFSIGRFTAEDGSDISVEAQEDDTYSFFLFHDGHLVGAILLGDTTLAAATKNAVEKRIDCSKLLKMNPQARDVLAFLGEHQ